MVLAIMFLVAFIVMMIEEAMAMFPLRKCDEYYSESAIKLICMYYWFHGYIGRVNCLGREK
jgi:hypothetical protein